MNEMNRSIIQKLDRPVVIIGMMGAGKTVTGRKLAHDLDLPFYDTDQVIEEKAGRPVAEIFEDFGESKFRQSEKKTVLELLSRGPCIIATGGGAPVNPGVMDAVKKHALSIWLRADIDVILERIKNRQTRPLLQRDNPRRVLENLLAKRTPFYSRADITVDSVKGKPAASMKKLIRSLYEYLNRDSF